MVDIIRVLTQQPDYQASRKYWKVLKGRLAKDGSELVTKCYQLKMAAGFVSDSTWRNSTRTS